jgi:hypothetical protein
VSGPADNDKRFEHVLTSILREDPGPSRQNCPHPGLLSAYFEGELTEPETRELEVHLSNCNSCQAELAALVRLQPEPGTEGTRAERVTAPPAIAAPSKPSSNAANAPPPPAIEAFSFEPRRRRTRWIWVAPAALAASAVLAISVTYRFAAPLIEQASRRSRESGVGARAPENTPPLAARRDEDTSAKEAPAAAPANQEGGPAFAKAAKPAAEHAVVIIARTNPDVAWRLRNASIERSDDAGQTWRAQPSGDATGLLAGSAPSPEVCWLAGRSGLVLRTTDGEDWERLASPTASDLTQVIASNAMNATVQTAGGERFFTSDGGRSWSKP